MLSRILSFLRPVDGREGYVYVPENDDGPMKQARVGDSA